MEQNYYKHLFSARCQPKVFFIFLMKQLKHLQICFCWHSAVFLCLVDSSPKISLSLCDSRFVWGSMWIRHMETQPVITWSQTTGKRQFTANPTLIINLKDSLSLVTENLDRLQSSNRLTQNVCALRRYLWASQNKFETHCNPFFIIFFTHYTLPWMVKKRIQGCTAVALIQSKSRKTWFKKSFKADLYRYVWGFI